MSDVSIILLTKNAGDKLNQVLNAIHCQSTGWSYQVIVVDSGSTDRTLQIAKGFETKIVEIEPSAFHHARTRNFGAELADGIYVIYLSQDAIPCSNSWLENMVAPLRSGEADVVYGRQVAYDNAKPMDKFFYKYFYPDCKLCFTSKQIADPVRFYLENPCISDVNVALSKALWSEFKFNNLSTFAEDKDFAIRVLRSGRKIVYEPNAAVYHSHDYSVRTLFVRRFQDGAAFSRIACLEENHAAGKTSFAKNGLRYYLSELRFLIKEGYAIWVLYAIPYALVFFMAFKSGEVSGKMRRNKGTCRKKCK